MLRTMPNYSGIRALLNELRRKAQATSDHYLGIPPPGFSTGNDWPRDAEVKLIENLILQTSKDVTGQATIPEELWRPCNDFAHEFSAPWRKRHEGEGTAEAQERYMRGESKFHEGIARWADHSLDYLKYLEAMAPGSMATTPAKPATILFLSANPSDSTRLRLDQELRDVREELERARLRDRFQLEARGAVRPMDFSRAILDLSPEFVHFSGHGSDAGAICVEDEQGKTREVPPQGLANLFRASGSHVQCVLLNACFSELQASAIAAHVPFVIGMKKEIGDDAAIAFARGFYRAIGAGRTVSESFQFGLVELGIYSIPEDSTPQLLHQGKSGRQ